MEIELDLRNEKAYLWQRFAVLVFIFGLVGIGMIGERVTPVTEQGSPKLISWQDWRLLQAERIYHAELEVLQADAEQLATMLESHPSPVAAQILAERIAKHTKSGDASLATARESLMIAALNVRDWAAGTLDRDSAAKSVQIAYRLLQQ